MSAIWWIYGIAAIAGVVGFYLGWNAIKRIRRPAERGDILLQWEETPMPFWLQDTVEAFSVVVNMSTILLLTLLLLVVVINEKFAAVDFPSVLMVLLPVAFVFFTAGTAFSFPFAGRLIRGPWVNFTPEGIIRGQWSSAWVWFSHFDIDSARGIVRIYSRRSPALTCYPWQFHDPDLYRQALSILGRYLPGYSPVQTLPWHKTRAGFVALTLLCTLPFLLVGLMVSIVAPSWVRLYVPVAVLLVSSLGGKLLGTAGPTAPRGKPASSN
jgi:hypothetical protein